MDTFLLSRELGNGQATSSLELEHTTRLMHSIQRASHISFHKKHPIGINALDIERQNSRYLLSAGADASISIWDLHCSFVTPSTALELKPIVFVPSTRSHKFGISSIFFYPSDNGLFITSSYDKTVKVWDTNAMEFVTEFNLEAIVNSAVMAPKSFHTLVAVSSQLPAVRLLDLNTGGNTHSLIGHTGGGTLGMGWSPRDEYILASGGVDGTVRLWDIRKTVNCLACLDMSNSDSNKGDWRNMAHHGAVNGVTWSEDGTCLVTFGHDDKMRVWDMGTGKNKLINFGPLIRNRHNRVLNPTLTTLRLSDPQLVFIPSGPSVLGFNLNEGTLFKRFNPPQSREVNALVQRPNCPEFYSASAGGKITAWVPEASLNGESEDIKNEELGNLDTIYHSLAQTSITFT